MIVPFYYKLYVRLIRSDSDNKEVDFIRDEKEFKNEDPIIAREEALRYYNNYIEVLLQGLGVVCESDFEIRTYLKPFIKQDTNLGSIEIAMVLHEDFQFNDLPRPVGPESNEFVIQSIPAQSELSLDQFMYNLVSELKYYKHFNYQTNSYERTVEFYGDIDEYPYDLIPSLNTYKILETPFTWNNYKEPRERREEFEKEFFWSGFGDNVANDQLDHTVTTPASIVLETETSQNVLTIIAKGEGSQIEFKPSLLHDYRSGERTERIKSIIAKGICSFLNAKGGYLFIGVGDKGQIDGLSNDYQYAPINKDKRDFLKREYTDMLKKYFSVKIFHYVNSNLVGINEQEVFIIKVFPSKNPFFIKGVNGKEFYVRSEGASERIVDIEEIVEYCAVHFK